MRINVLQHTPNEGPGSIRTWAEARGHELYIYHPYQFAGNLPTFDETEMLVILGGPMSPNDDISWIKQERDLIAKMLQANRPIYGACYGAQQIAKTMGCEISKAPFKEVGWANVYRKSTIIPNLPDKMMALHWHEEMFEVPKAADLLFSSDLLRNQGFILNNKVIGLQFHFEPQANDVREIVVNDAVYALENNALKQTPNDILDCNINFAKNKAVMNKLLDFITQK